MLDNPGLGVGSWPWRRARITPDRIALAQGDRTVTYRALAERTRRLGEALRGLGVRRGDRVAYLGANDISALEMFFAAGQIGALFVPLNIRLSAVEIGYMLEDCGASVLAYGAGMTLPSGISAHLVGPDDYEQLVQSGSADVALEPVGLEEAAVILYTSGTTGKPKGAVLTHGNLTWNTMNQLAHYDALGTDRVLCIAPLFHVTGLGQVTMPTLFKGGCVEVVARFEPGEVLAAISRGRIAGFAAVPVMLKLMSEHPSWPAADLSSLRYVNYGGSAVEERVARAWQDKGVMLYQGYGMTETTAGVTMALGEGALERPVSVGPPHFYTEIAGLRDDHAAALVAGEPAELLVRGANVFSRYWEREEDTAASFVDGWFRTGDVVRQDPDGWSSVVDRVKDMIISGAENVYPAEVEAIMLQRDEVADCAVVAVPDERWGEVGAAFVVRRTGLSEATLRAHLESNLAKYKVPKYFRFVDELPRSATGKVRRTDLRRTASEWITED
ncbi:fatty-acyl-CoA synthase [Antricoccus suffuscus]|uniref:Fatty-acyl-CoA synthase n=1 Tax=Antricoccus suffuscus TaxID=1629062 RepID=A0A2T1A1R4_9ACTN|nr:long-chain fatty acid--CoA ligase [Antricoccus suffuscus]PRZ42474.1 fatty-acyl-CoA synthase [Antricoccus suffuscus]